MKYLMQTSDVRAGLVQCAMRVLLLIFAFGMSAQVWAFDETFFPIKGASQPYPKGAGMVYSVHEKQDVKAIPEDAWKDYAEVAQTAVFDMLGFYTYGKPAEGYQWTGVAYGVKNDAGEWVPATKADGSIDCLMTEDPYCEAMSSGSGVYTSEEEAMKAMPEEPDTMVLALFGRVGVACARHMRLLGRVALDNPCNEMGDEVTLTAIPNEKVDYFVYWTKGDPENGEKITDNPLKVKVEESTMYYAHFDSPRAVHFKGDEGTLLWYDANSYSLPGYLFEGDSSIVSERFPNGLFDETSPTTGIRSSYLKAEKSNYSMYGTVPHVLTVNGPALMVSTMKGPGDMISSNYSLAKWTGEKGLTADQGIPADGVENYFYYIDTDNRCFHLTHDTSLDANTIVLVLKNNLLDGEEAPTRVFWTKADQEAFVPSTLAEFTLADGDAYTNREEVMVEKFSYTRHFEDTNWQALYLPVKVPVSTLANQGLTVAFINNFSQNDAEGGSLDNMAMEIIYVKPNSTLLPHTPYIVRAEAPGEKDIVVENTLLYPTEKRVLDYKSATFNYTITGNYSPVFYSTLNAQHGYVMEEGIPTQVESNQGQLVAERWYLNIEARDPMYETMIPRQVRIRVMNDSNEQDGILTVETASPASSAPFHDLSGRRVTPVSKGLYIRDGKKILK